MSSTTRPSPAAAPLEPGDTARAHWWSERRIPFRLAILLLFLVPMILTVMAIVYKMSERAESVVYQLSSRIVAEIGEKVVARAAAIVQVAEAHLVANAAVATALPIIPGQVTYADLFWQQMVFTPELSSLYLGDRDGSFVQARAEPEPATRVIDRTVTPPTERISVRARDYRPIAHLLGDATYDPRQRAWYKDTLAQRRVQWSQVYRFASSGRLGITASYPLLDQRDRILAVLGVDVTLDGLSEFLGRQSLGLESAALIIDDEQRLIAYPPSLDLISDPAAHDRLPSVSDLAPSWLSNALRAIGPPADQTSAALERSETDAPDSLTHIIDFGDDFALPWRLVIVLSKDELLSAAQRSLQEAIVVSAIIVMIVLFVVYPLAATFARSVNQLTRNADLLQRFRSAEVVPVRSGFREIRDLDRSICTLRDTLRLIEDQLPTEVIRQLAGARAQIDLQIEFKTLTVMACALDNLDPLMETRQPQEVTAFLIDQVRQGTNIVKDAEGTFDAFRGDRFHALWSRPAAPDHAVQQACHAALAFAHFSALNAAQHGVTGLVSHHSGLHSGRGLIGNLGLAGRLRYTAMGRLVGIAARLRDANGLYGTQVIISAAVHHEVKERFICRPLDLIQLPGETQATPIYELRGEMRASPSAAELGLIESCTRALEHYRARAWREAIAAWREALTHVPDDQASQVLIARCERLATGAAAVTESSHDGDSSGPWDADPTIS